MNVNKNGHNQSLISHNRTMFQISLRRQSTVAQLVSYGKQRLEAIRCYC